MSFSLPVAMREYIDDRVRSGEYGNTSEYLRELIRRDQADQARGQLRERIAEGLESGAGRRFDRRAETALRRQALGAS